MTHMDQVLSVLNTTAQGKPIYTAEVAERFIKEYGMEPAKAKAAVSVALKRIIDKGLCPELRCYQKGIYYRTSKTPFGETGINKEALIAQKYLYHDNGYETGYAALYQMRLTTQLPAQRVIATNIASDGLREDKRLGIFVRPAKTKINTDNKQYLQLLDVVELLDKSPIDEGEPYKILATHIQKNGLMYGRLLAIADNYYPKNTVIQIAHIAAAGGSV